MAPITLGLTEAILHHRSGGAAAAERLYRDIIRSQPRHAIALHLLGLLCHQTDRHEEAAQWISRAIAADPVVPEFHSDLAGVLGHLGRFEEALAALHRAIELRPDHPKTHHNLGVTFERMARPAEAAEAYRQAIALRPEYAEAHYHLGNARRTLGRLVESEASYRKAVWLRPDFAAPYHARAGRRPRGAGPGGRGGPLPPQARCAAARLAAGP